MLACYVMGRGDVGVQRPQTTSDFQPLVTSRNNGSPCKFGINIPFVLLFLLLLIACSSTEIPLPQSIGSMRLEKVLSGEEARQEIDRLHGKQISLLRGYIGTYVAENGRGGSFGFRNTVLTERLPKPSRRWPTAFSRGNNNSGIFGR